jgi:transcriptional regulator with XRE-family HTH domain
MRKRTAADELLDEVVGNDPKLRTMIREEYINSMCSKMIYEARQAAGLTQAELARRVGTSQAAIARLEDADYGIARTIPMMYRIADALGLEYNQGFTPIAQSNDIQIEVTGDPEYDEWLLNQAANNNYAFAA